MLILNLWYDKESEHYVRTIIDFLPI